AFLADVFGRSGRRGLARSEPDAGCGEPLESPGTWSRRHCSHGRPGAADSGGRSGILSRGGPEPGPALRLQAFRGTCAGFPCSTRGTGQSLKGTVMGYFLLWVESVAAIVLLLAATLSAAARETPRWARSWLAFVPSLAVLTVAAVAA